MHPRPIPTTPRADDTDLAMDSSTPNQTGAGSGPASNFTAARPITTIPAFTREYTSPGRFASTANAFGLAVSPTSSTSSSSRGFGGPSAFGSGSISTPTVETSPPSAGALPTRRMRRPSLLSLTQTPSFSKGPNDVSTKTALPTTTIQDPSSSNASAQVAQASQATNGPQLAPELKPTLLQRRSMNNPFAASSGFAAQAAPLWAANNTSTPFLTNSLLRRTSSAPPLAIDALTTRTPPMPNSATFCGARSQDPDDGETGMEFDADQLTLPPAPPDSPLRWIPNHLNSSASARRKGKAKMEDPDADISGNQPTQPHNPPFTGRPLHASLLATIISESAPLEHEMRSEARLQRLLSSHPSALPLTPRAPRASRGRFPETAGDDDDDEGESFGRSWSRRTWLGRRTSDSDSDSDDMPMVMEENEGEVNMAFAAGMDMDRPDSSSSNGLMGTVVGSRPDSSGIPGGGGPLRPGSAQGLTPGSGQAQWGQRVAPRMSFGAAGAGMVPSPGSGLGLPSAFGGLGMGGSSAGIGTPLGSPTIERLELVGSPGAGSVTSPGMMQYRESTAGSASMRPGKRKAQDDRFDPYKRPRGTSPSLLSASPSLAMSPSRTTSSMPIPQSPSHAPMYSSQLSSSAQNNMFARTNRYPRPMPRSRSRAASPALSIGSTSGVLSTSLGNNGPGGRPSVSLGQAFIPTGPGSAGLVAGMNAGQAQGLGGLGLLSLSARERGEASNARSITGVGVVEEDDEGGVEMLREDSGMSRDAMEED